MCCGVMECWELGTGGRGVTTLQTSTRHSTTDIFNTATLIYENNLINYGMVGCLHLTGCQKKATKEADSYLTLSYLTLGCWSKQTVGKQYK